MVYTEVRRVGARKKYYRVYTYRKGGKVAHRRIFLGTDLGVGLRKGRERAADLKLQNPLDRLLSGKDMASLAAIKRAHQAKPVSTLENRYEAFLSDFTYDSAGIEGNTLTLRETAAVLFEGATPAKSLREVYEVLNHRRAFDCMLEHSGGLNKRFLCKLQKIVTENTLKPEQASEAGRYRTVQVFIRGARVTPPPPGRVAKEMRSLLAWYGKNKAKLHPVVLAAYFHSGFEAIHPFSDGNGRAGRLFLNFILRSHGYPMVTIPRSQRTYYFSVLAKAQVGGNLKPFVQYLARLLSKSEKSV